ncbi:nuclear transport factor 2 family protein [Demequina iriomotensis]|uniref:nuclear transport factor 2 family protein n=1 Tax=Demequina iriomotensis TaxID=1536641 RepID=UPI00078413BF|nr:nuclear transport factor 2 family protein [Demequina iriomotensis]
MTDATPASPEIRAELLALEERRRRALIDVDLDTLGDLYDDALVHIHAPGLVHSKEMLLEHTATRRPYLDMWRGDLEIRVLGDVAIMTGLLTNRLRNPDGTSREMTGQVTQVIRRCDDGAWRYLSFQMTPLTEQVWGTLPSETKD